MIPTTYVYVIGRENGPVKIGITASLFTRLQSLQTASSFPIKLLYAMPADNRDRALYHEQNIHAIYAKNRLSGEWFDLNAELAIEAVQNSFQIEEWFVHDAIFRKRA